MWWRSHVGGRPLCEKADSRQILFQYDIPHRLHVHVGKPDKLHTPAAWYDRSYRKKVMNLCNPKHRHRPQATTMSISQESHRVESSPNVVNQTVGRRTF